MSRSFFFFQAILCLSVALSGCRESHKTPPPPIPEVVVATVQARDVPESIETDGFSKAFEYVDIPARISGFLKQRRYTPGEIVQAGDPLFLIEPDQYLAEVEAAEAALESAKAQLSLDEANLVRTRRLIEQGAKTEEDFQTDQAKRNESAAEVKRAGAALTTAKLNLSYTDVRSPITGKAGENLVDVGNLVGPQTDHTVLTTVAGMDPIYIYFEISDYEFNHVRDFSAKNDRPNVAGLAEQLRELRRQNRAPQSVSEGADDLAAHPAGAGKDDPVRLHGLRGGVKWQDILFEVALVKGAAPNTREYPFKGLIDMTSNVINQSTGTITVRGVIPNSDYTIFPGQVCYVRIPTGVVKDALLVEERAVLTDMNNRYVYVVDDKNKAARRDVVLGKLQPDGTRIIEKGLEKGERYILRGGQKVRNHGQVKPKPTSEK